MLPDRQHLLQGAMRRTTRQMSRLYPRITLRQHQRRGRLSMLIRRMSRRELGRLYPPGRICGNLCLDLLVQRRRLGGRERLAHSVLVPLSHQRCQPGRQPRTDAHRHLFPAKLLDCGKPPRATHQHTAANHSDGLDQPSLLNRLRQGVNVTEALTMPDPNLDAANRHLHEAGVFDAVSHGEPPSYVVLSPHRCAALPRTIASTADPSAQKRKRLHQPGSERYRMASSKVRLNAVSPIWRHRSAFHPILTASVICRPTRPGCCPVEQPNSHLEPVTP